MRQLIVRTPSNPDARVDILDLDRESPNGGFFVVAVSVLDCEVMSRWMEYERNTTTIGQFIDKMV